MTQTSVMALTDYVSPMFPVSQVYDFDAVINPAPVAFAPREECSCADCDPRWEDGTGCVAASHGTGHLH